MKFNKEPTTLEVQVSLLKSRGVEMDNDSAMQILSQVNYDDVIILYKIADSFYI